MSLVQTEKCLDELRNDTNHGFYYLASPYSHEDPLIVRYRANEAERAVAWLTIQQIVVFGAINHSHPLVKYGHGLDGSWKTWEKIDNIFMSKSEGLIILGLQGWTESKGVRAEVEYAIANNKPIYMMFRRIDGEDSIFNYTISKLNPPKEV